MSGDFADLPRRLLDWYARHARNLPWRTGPTARAAGERPDPYRVWLSEIMLQQTTIPHGTRYFLDFTRRWPTVEALAAADDDAVMAAWAGLGYYARARNLLKCARQVAARGGFPDTVEGLKALPGIGPYTAGAIAALAFDRRAAAVDGNVERVFARLMALDGPWDAVKAQIREVVDALVPDDRPAEFAEAVMDLGATVCAPKSPNCLVCPLAELCAARAGGAPEAYPRKPARKPKPLRTGHVFILSDGKRIQVEKRPESGLLGGMLGLPGGAWTESTDASVFDAATAPVDSAPGPAEWTLRGEVRHVFTHFELRLKVWFGHGPVEPPGLTLDRVSDLPSVFKKAVKLAL